MILFLLYISAIRHCDFLLFTAHLHSHLLCCTITDSRASHWTQLLLLCKDEWAWTSPVQQGTYGCYHQHSWNICVCMHAECALLSWHIVIWVSKNVQRSKVCRQCSKQIRSAVEKTSFKWQYHSVLLSQLGRVSHHFSHSIPAKYS